MTDKVQKIRKEVERIKTNANKRGAISKHTTMVVCDEILSLIDSLQEEPVSEDLGEYINELSKQFSEVSFAKLSRVAVRVAQWQKEQFEKNRLKYCNSITNEQAELESEFIDQHLEKNNRMPTFLDAIEYGMEYGKQQMLKESVDVTAHVGAGGYPYIPQLELYDYDKDVPLAKEGDKYKVLLIKGNKYGNSRKATI